MPVEPARVDRARHAGRERQLADVELCASGSRAVQPGADLFRYSGADQRVVERRAIALHDHALAARVPDRDLGLDARQDEVRPTALAHLQGQHLAEPVVADGDVTAVTQLQVVQRRLEGEPAAVHRRRQRQHRRLEVVPDGAEPLDAGPEFEIAHRPEPRSLTGTLSSPEPDETPASSTGASGDGP